MKLYEHNCVGLHGLDPQNLDFTEGDVQDAALYFIAAAHPSSRVVQNIKENFASLKKGITATAVSHLTGRSNTGELHNVPYTESPVKTEMVFVQTPCGEQSCEDGASSRLDLVWRLEVEMQDNWYEAYVDIAKPSRIISVVDWVSDSSEHSATASKCWPSSDAAFAPIPKEPKTDKNGVREVIYKVWPWGINDPSEGKKAIVKTPYDKVASPLGWHAIPSQNNPRDEGSLAEPASGFKDEICNFTTTWGNNVS